MNFIKWIQKLLNHEGFKLDIDGIYGVNTKKAILDFQSREGLEMDGILGSNTLERLLLKNEYNVDEAYVNSRNLTSTTKYLIWVKSDTHKVNIFHGKQYEWILEKSYLATLGKEDTPTPKGKFKVLAKGEGYGGPKYGFRVRWYTQFYKNYLFHTILFNLDGKTIFDGRLGLNLSDGCIRLKEAEAKYIYDKIPYGTTVIIT